MARTIEILGRLRSLKITLEVFLDNAESVCVSARGLEIRRGGILEGVTGRGVTADDALWALWTKITATVGDGVGDGSYLVVNAMQPTRRAVVWDGFSWAAVGEAPA